MAVAMYNVGKSGLLDGTIDWLTDDIYVTLMDTGYTFSAAHATMETANFPAANREGDNVALGSKTVSATAMDAADTTITSVPSGQTIDAIVVYKHVSGASSSDIPICFIDTGTGFDLSTDGNNVVITWNASGIIAIS